MKEKLLEATTDKLQKNKMGNSCNADLQLRHNLCRLPQEKQIETDGERQILGENLHNELFYHDFSTETKWLSDVPASLRLENNVNDCVIIYFT